MIVLVMIVIVIIIIICVYMLYIYIYIYTHVCIHVYIYIYIYILVSLETLNFLKALRTLEAKARSNHVKTEELTFHTFQTRSGLGAGLSGLARGCGKAAGACAWNSFYGKGFPSLVRDFLLW